MLIIGLDLSLNSTGVCKYNTKNGKYKTFTITHKLIGVERMAYIIEYIGVWLNKYSKKKVLIVIEGFSYGKARSKVLVQFGGLGYGVRMCLLRNGFKYIVCGPLQLKKFVTGKGSGGKDKVILHAYKKWGVEFDTNDECDAYCLCKIGEAYKKKMKLPKYQKEVIDKMKKDSNLE